jgi:ubiquinone/menaquinone biosynthesis C-methylase UbiE
VSEQYHHRHPEIFELEKDRWVRIAGRFFDFAKPIKINDIGTGTGFVPLTIAKFLKIEDTFICSDISKNILGVAERNIKKQNFQCQFEFVKIESRIPFQLPFETESAEVLTVNSVLHHIENTSVFLSELDRILKPQGLVFIGHEPNKYFHENTFLRCNHFFINNILNPRLVVSQVSTKLGVEKIVRKIYYFMNSMKERIASEFEKITDKINESLLKENLINTPLLSEEITGITDIKDCEGFKPDLLLPHYELLHLETYNHILRVSIERHDGFVIRRYDSLLKKKYPKEGATFFVVLKK